MKIDLRILVMLNGFVSVGSFSAIDGFFVLENAAVIRRWGTERGLGQIAEEGPTKNTILDKTPTERIPQDKVIKMIDCTAVKEWKKALGIK